MGSRGSPAGTICTARLNKALLRLGTVPNQARKRGSGNPLAGFVLCRDYLYSSVHVFTI